MPVGMLMMFNGTRRVIAAMVAVGFLAAATVNAQSLDFETIGGEFGAIPSPKTGSVGKQLTPQQIVSLGSGGSLGGNVSVFATGGLETVREGISVLLIRDGRIVSSSKTDSGGDFVFSRMNSGVYTVMAAGGDFLAVFAVTVVPAGGIAADSLDIVGSTGMPLDRSMSILAGLRRVLPGNETPLPRYRPDAGVAIGNYRVVLDASGVFGGYLSIPGVSRGSADLSSMQVRVIRGGKVVAESKVAADGRYEVDAVGVGPAGVMMFGPSGFAAFGVEFLDGNLQARRPEEAQRLVSLQDRPQGDPPGELNVDISPTNDAQAGLEEVQQQLGEDSLPPGPALQIPPPLAGGGLAAAGPGGGFGGGGGGTGGLGGIAGLAAIGATAAAALISSDDDDNRFTPPPASPAIP